MALVRYITVEPVTNFFKPATRAFGNIVILGTADAEATGPENTPIAVTNPDEVSHRDRVDAEGAPIVGPVDGVEWFRGDLGTSVRLAMGQSPGPSLVFALRLGGGAGALEAGLTEAAKLDAQFVVLANQPLSSASGTAEIEALAAHVNSVSNTGGDGKERMGVAMLVNGETDASVISSAMASERMVIVAHKSTQDAAAGVAGTIAGHRPHISVLLKQVNLSMADTFTDAEISDFDDNRVNWLTDPVLIPGRSLMLGEAYTLGPDKPYIDIVRVIDDISFRLKARLIRSIGNLRVSRAGLRALSARMAGVLEPLKQDEVIEDYDVFIPLQALLDKDPSTLTDVELQQISDARSERTVAAIISVEYAGAIHRLNITLKFV
jgi:hypothetical protein